MWLIAGMVLAVVHGESALATEPIYESRILSSGSYWLTLANFGSFGGFPARTGESIVSQTVTPREDLRSFGINWVPSFEFPAGSRNNYLYACGLQVGGIVVGDTLVSTVYIGSVPTFSSEWISYDVISEVSNEAQSGRYDPRAVAQRQFNCVYTDTTWIPFVDGIEQRTHQPLGLEVYQRTIGWTSGNASQFAIIDLTVRNIGAHIIAKPALAFAVSPRIWNYDRPGEVDGGSIIGFTQVIPGLVPGTLDSLPIVWAADNDGNPVGGKFDRWSMTGVLGLAVLHAPSAKLSFNWWAYGFGGDSWGPMKAVSRLPHYGSLGRPPGDRALYDIMTNGEIDYDQVTAAKDYSSEGWARPLANSDVMRNIADGTLVEYMISWESDHALRPGDSTQVTLALVAGENFHIDPDNYVRNFNVVDPSEFLQGLNFSDLYLAAHQADWVFDSPGVDTDGDGYFGEYHLTNCRGPSEGTCDTVWYHGDGVPDWGGTKPPPSPRFEISTRPHEITLHWNGAYSETARDHFSRRHDFEGYRVYSARTNNPNEYALIASWDIPDNFRRFAYDEGRANWIQISYPLRTDEWRKVLNDPEFDPSDYAHPSFEYAYKDTIADTSWDNSGTIINITTHLRRSYWLPQGPNHGNTYPDGDEVYPNRIQRVEIRDTIVGEDTLQYGVYEMTIDNLNAAIPLWMGVTSFDHGDYKRIAEELEGEPNANAQFAFPVYSADVVTDSGLRVAVYPNPYKTVYTNGHGDRTTYYAEGFEGYGLPRMSERERRIWFANLPDTATIRIYSLDGDLIREIHHPDPFLTRYSSIVGWDLISRNTQAVVSGIYIWRVDSRLGSQVGKIVIIK